MNGESNQTTSYWLNLRNNPVQIQGFRRTINQFSRNCRIFLKKTERCQHVTGGTRILTDNAQKSLWTLRGVNHDARTSIGEAPVPDEDLIGNL